MAAAKVKSSEKGVKDAEKALDKEAKKDAKVVVVLGEGKFMAFDASEWEKFLRAANNIGADMLEVYPKAVIARSKEGAVALASRTLTGEEKSVIRYDMSSNQGTTAPREELTREQLRKAGGLEPSETDAKAGQVPAEGENVAGKPEGESAGGFKMTPEMERKAAELRRLLGSTESEEVHEPSALTEGEARRVYALGVDFACDFLQQGVTWGCLAQASTTAINASMLSLRI